jgi:galactokinase
MTSLTQLAQTLQNGGYAAALADFYGEDAAKQQDRLQECASFFARHFGTDACVELFSAPGRSEIGGNHTDHNCGKVLAASVNLDVIAVAARRADHRIMLQSAGHDLIDISTEALAPLPEERGHSAALVRGVCAGFAERGYRIGGFNAASISDVLSGSGLSSSAAFEVLVGTILNHFYNGGQVEALTIAQIAQYAENRFFGKPCGLLDQTACAVGGFVSIDFEIPAAPVVRQVRFDFASCGHALCIVNSGGSHADLTDAYAAVRGEMERVARTLGKTMLRETSREELLANLAVLREQVGDRAVLRALHFFGENDRVDQLTKALAANDFERFKRLIVESGRSSFMYNQNVYTGGASREQSVALALALSEHLLAGRGAWRVHGGGFAGTIQAFVPLELLEEYRSTMETLFGAGSCYVLRVRPQGGARIPIFTAE